MRRTHYLISMLLLFGIDAMAGEKIDSAETSPFDRTLVLAIDYSSDRVFYGRRSDNRILYYSPSLFYQGKSGFYSGLASYRLIKPVNRWDELQLTAGWDFPLFRTLYTSLSYSRFAYSDSSVQIQSSLKNNIQLMTEYDSSFIVPRFTAGLYFGDSSPDYLFALNFSHEFAWQGARNAFYMKPAVSFSAGTLHYYRLALRDTTRRLRIEEETRFNLTGIDFLFPVEYDIRRFILFASANYNIPLNQPRYLKAEPGFYFTVGVGFRIL